MNLNRPHTPACRGNAARAGSVLIIVLWVLFGLISMALYFANSMMYELRASDNRVAGIEAEQAIEGARRYVTCMLTNLNQPGAVPDPMSFPCGGVDVGGAKFWLIGRTNVQSTIPTAVGFGLIDEAAKLNLNAPYIGTNLFLLPRVTMDLTNNILAWSNTNTVSSTGAAESSTYSAHQPPYYAKNGKIETVEELRLVSTMDIDVLYGEDANLNGFLDPNENDGDVLAPTDNSDGHLDPGLLEYLTVYTREPATQTNGAARFNITTAAGVQSLATNMETVIGGGSSVSLGSGTNTGFTSLLQMYSTCSQRGMTVAQFAQIESSIRGSNIVGLININTATIAVLQCLPGMDTNKATTLVQYRDANQSNPANLNTVSWVATSQVLDAPTMLQLGPWITGKSYQFTADVAAVGHNGRGYRRTRFVFDVSSGTPIIVYRRDLTRLGWALGKSVRDQLVAANQ